MRLVICSCSQDVADSITNNIFQSRMAAFVNVLPGVKTVISQKELPSIQTETLLLIQTPLENLDPLFNLIVDLHPSKTPAIIALPITSGNYDYLKWAEEELGRENQT